MKKMLMVMAVVAMLAGCASLPPYFTNPQNTQVFAELGMDCVLAQPQEYAAGLMYEYLKTPTGYSMSQQHLIKVAVQCGSMITTVLCDPAKPAAQNPCGNLQRWSLVPPAAKTCK